MRPLVRPSGSSCTRYLPIRKRARSTASIGSSARRRRRNRLRSDALAAPDPGALGVALTRSHLELRLLEQVLGVALLVAMGREIREVVGRDVAGDVLAVEAGRLEARESR